MGKWNWRWVVDRRGGGLSVDGKVLFVSVAAGMLFAKVARYVIPGNWYYLVIVGMGGLLIPLDILLRRRPDKESSHSPSAEADL